AWFGLPDCVVRFVAPAPAAKLFSCVDTRSPIGKVGTLSVSATPRLLAERCRSAQCERVQPAGLRRSRDARMVQPSASAAGLALLGVLLRHGCRDAPREGGVELLTEAEEDVRALALDDRATTLTHRDQRRVPERLVAVRPQVL